MTKEQLEFRVIIDIDGDFTRSNITTEILADEVARLVNASRGDSTSEDSAAVVRVFAVDRGDEEAPMLLRGL